MLLTLFLFEKIILLMAICAGKAVNRDSINTKVFEEERVGFGEGGGAFLQKGPSPIHSFNLFKLPASASALRGPMPGIAASWAGVAAMMASRALK